MFNNISSASFNSVLFYIGPNVNNNTFSDNILFSNQSTIFHFQSDGSGSPKNNTLINNTIINLPNLDIYFFSQGINETRLTDQIIRNYTFLDSIIIVKNSSYGEARFLRGLNGSGNNLSADIFFSNNSVYINETIAGSGLNRSANITLYGIGNRGFTAPVIIRNNIECNSTTSPRCYNFTALTADTVLFNISSAGNYSINGSGAGDTTFPLISFGTLTQANSSNVSVNWVFMNVSVTEANEANITFRLYNSSTNVNTTTFATSQRTLNVTNLVDGVYTYNVSVVDTSNNRNTTETRTILLDTALPLVTINAPSNTTYTAANQSFNVTINENGTCNYTLNGGAVNLTMQNNANRNFNATNSSLANAGYTFRAYCFDTVGNANLTTSVNFAVNVPASSPSETPASSGGGGGSAGSSKPESHGVVQCEESWSCSAWSDCSSGRQTRQCAEANNCGTSVNKPAVEFSCQINDFFIEKSPTTAGVDVKKENSISFSINVRDDSLLAEPTTIGVEWKIDGEKTKSEFGIGSVYSSFSRQFAKDSIVSVVVSTKYRSKELLWNIKSVSSECREDWQCEWGKCSNGFVVPFS
ncbi:MAG: hypothetical protein AABX65_04400, partial [Nanoarchaeota archaeon]